MTTGTGSDENIRRALESGDVARAEHACREWLRASPDDESALSWLAYAQQQQGRLDAAIETCRRLTALHPRTGGHWGNLGTYLRAAGRHAEACVAYEEALRLAPEDSFAKANLGLLCMDQGALVQARDLLVDAAFHQFGDLSLRISAALAAYECGDTLALEHLLADWRAWPELDESLRIDLAWLFSQTGKASEAERLLGSMRALDGGRPRTLARLVMLYERVNRLEEARGLLARLPDPQTLADDGEREDVAAAICTMAMRGPNPAVAKSQLEKLIAQMGGHRHRSNLYFTLAKACDKLGDTDAALRALEQAHAAQLETASQLVPDLLAPDVQPLTPALVRMTQAQVVGWSTVAAEGPPAPVFVVGFPRSGTTMLEQMLDAHPTLASMDERPFLQELVDETLGWGLVYPEALGQLEEGRCASLRKIYWARVEEVVQLKPGQRLVDKNPLNLLHLPLIRRLFPDAKVILALRHPCDVILSNYMQNFRAPGYQVLCSSLDRLARGYVNAMQYVIHHEALLGLPILHHRYEDMLDDFDASVERIGEFIGLDDASHLHGFDEHARRKGFISTPSYAQVTQPPNKQAVGRWRRYEKAFAPLLPTLREIMEHWGYDT